MLFQTLRPSTSSLPIVVAQPDERHANIAAFVLERMANTKHSTASDLNEEEHEI